MSTTTDDDTVLDAAAMRKIIHAMSEQETEIFSELLEDVREAGSGATPDTIKSLAKKYVSKARRLAGEGAKSK